MIIKLTQQLVDAAGIELWDEEVPGLCLRIGVKRRTYSAMPRVDGKQVRVKIGTTDEISLEGARKKAREILGHRPDEPDEAIQPVKKIKFIRKAQAAAKMGVTVRTIERWASSDEYKYLNFPPLIQIGPNVVGFNEDDLDAWLRSRTTSTVKSGARFRANAKVSL